ncbi:MAG: pre-peptidase C-terminal domain-containing protein [Anaerolineae bacterium]|nr:pre-peptidase C-terminal domain-containing protein [Anaerolineae bacterium]
MGIKRMRWMLIGVVGLLAASAAAQEPPRPINYGQTVEGELNDVQQAQQFLFDGQSGDEITILMATTSGDLNPFLTLATFDGDVLATDDDTGGAGDALIEITLEANGTYVITASRSRASGTGGSGTYSLTLSTGEPAGETPIPALDVGARLQPIVRGEPVRGALTRESAFVLYWFEGRSGQSITITPDSGTQLQPLLVLYDASFREIFRTVSGNTLSANLPNDGVYFLSVALPEATSVGGNYALTMTSVGTASQPRDVQPGQNTITYGESVRGVINATAPSYSFQFRGSAGDSVIITMSRAGGDLDSYLYLLDTAGITIAEDDSSGGINGDARVAVSLPADGTYNVLATRRGQDAGTTAGTFLLELQSDAEPVSVATTSPDVPPNLAGFPEITYGETVQGEISNQSVLNVYIFKGEAEDEISVTLESPDGGLDPYLFLLDANQVPIAENDDIIDGQNRNSQIEFVVPESGYYVIVATRFEQDAGTTAGPFALTLRRAGDPVSPETANSGSFVQRLGAQRINAGDTPDGAFQPLQFTKVYTFPASAGTVIDFSVTTDDNSATTVILTNDRMQPIASTDSGTLLGVSVPSTGNYLIFIAPARGPAVPTNVGYILAFNATGNEFAVEEEATAEATAEATEEAIVEEATPTQIPLELMTYGDTVTGTLDEEVTSLRYLFTGNEGDIVRIQMSAASGNLDTLIELLDENERLIDTNDDIVQGVNRNSSLQVALPSDGQYIIRATRFEPTDGTPPTTGDFTLSLTYVDPAAAGVSPVALPISPGETVVNTITDEQYLLFYTFNGKSGDTVTIEVNTQSGDLDAVLYLYAYTSSGDPIEIARNDDDPRGNTFDPLIQNQVLPRTGSYLIAVGRFPDSTSTGNFTMSLTIQPAGVDSDG